MPLPLFVMNTIRYAPASSGEVADKSVWNRFGHCRRAGVVRSTEAQEVPSQRLNASAGGASVNALYFVVNRSSLFRRGGRAVECTGLENRQDFPSLNNHPF